MHALQVLVQCPAVEDSEQLNGQILEVEVGTLSDTIGELKARLTEVVGMPANKQRLSRDPIGFLKDELSLAHYNVSPSVHLQLSLKERGGRKK